MKRIVFFVIVILVSLVFLCAFTLKNSEKENYNLQNSVFLENDPQKYSLTSPDYIEGCSDKNADIDEELNKIFSDFKNLLPDGVPTDSEEILGAVGITEIVEYVMGLLSGNQLMETFCMLMGIALLFCLCEILTEDSGEIYNGVKGASALVLSIPVLRLGNNIISYVGEGIASGSEFFSGIIPILSSVAAIGAGAVTSGAATLTMNMSLSFVSGVLANNLLPISTLIFCISLLSSFDTGHGVSNVAKGIRGWFNFLIGIVSMLIVATLGAQTLISSSRDGLALRSAKYALSGMIPIVGSTVSGTLSLLISGVKLLSGTIGVLSVIALLSFMGAPLITLLFYRFCVGACITLTSFSGASGGERFFSSLRGAVDCLIAVLVCSLLVFILEIIILVAVIGNIG